MNCLSAVSIRLVAIIISALIVVLAVVLLHYRFEIRLLFMDGYRFERFVARIYENNGYSVTVTKKSGDQGVDIIALKMFVKTGIQVKKYRGKVSNRAVQEVVAGKKYYGLQRAVVITSGTFTKSAKELAKSNKVKLIDGKELKILYKKSI